METKLSVMRAFGSEQFSATVTLDHSTTEDEVRKGLEILNRSLETAFDTVLLREEAEKKKLIYASEKREFNQRELDAQLKKEMEAAAEAKKTIQKADSLKNQSKQHGKRN